MKFMKAANSIDKSRVHLQGFIEEDGKLHYPSGYKPYKGPLDMPTLDEQYFPAASAPLKLSFEIPRGTTIRKAIEILYWIYLKVTVGVNVEAAESAMLNLSFGSPKTQSPRPAMRGSRLFQAAARQMAWATVSTGPRWMEFRHE